MTLVRFEPFRGFEKMNRRLGRLAHEMEKGVSFEMGSFAPRVDVTENDKHVFVHAELPGMAKEDITIAVNEENMLVISGTKEKTAEQKDRNYVRTERAFGEFKRSFILGDNLDVENIDAKFDNGVLELAIAKVEPPKPKEITVEIK